MKLVGHCAPPDQRFVHQRSQDRQGGAGHFLRGLASETALEDGQLLEHGLFISRQPAPRPIEDRPQAALPGRHVAAGGGQEVQALFDLPGNLGAGELACPGRGQLDAQRQPLHRAADAGNRGQLSRLRLEIRLYTARPAQEKLDRSEGFGIDGGGRRRRQAVQGKHPLGLQIQPLARGDQQLDERRLRQQLTQPTGLVEQVFQIVQHQQQLPIAHEVQHLPGQRRGAGRAHGQGGSQDRRQRVGLCGDCGQRCKPDAVEEHGLAGAGRLHSQSGLAYAARPQQGQQPGVRRGQQAAQLGHFMLAADETGGGGRQVVARALAGRADALEERRGFG